MMRRGSRKLEQELSGNSKKESKSIRKNLISPMLLITLIVIQICSQPRAISDQIDCLDNHSRFVELQEKQHPSNKSVKGRLKDNIEYWRDRYQWLYFINNRKRLRYTICYHPPVVRSMKIIEQQFNIVASLPFIFNPLSVVLNSSGKRGKTFDFRFEGKKKIGA